ncbi:MULTISPECIES: hypothetical protein [Paenibacillus]|jgi:hypothetical protein|uniref:Uncharacterized protein n=1 Tax=Paenibacillus barengoltzii J12 TaxID=935846 RepID=A0ABY1M4H3_9BACL|nr:MULTISPECIES: hypothetical protein [Paenibacillus]SMF56022.1 hypothetical protein SAMN02744124_03711 [Paenibacillus barengoltzii J12]SMF60973.1 hypothetical protein SAMN02744102_04189 [Paenibacillus barengoltzii]
MVGPSGKSELEIEERLNDLEKRLYSQNKRWKVIRNILLVIGLVWFALILVGVIQFMSSGS